MLHSDWEILRIAKWSQLQAWTLALARDVVRELTVQAEQALQDGIGYGI
jgi:hypothetical protein